MVLITSAKYVNPELQAEFGKIPPSFLPLGGKRLYEYQIKLFDTHSKNIVLSIPESFSLTKSDKKKLDLLNVKIISVPDDLTLGESIVYAVNMNLPIDTNLEILHGDTYFKELNTHHNSVSISIVESSYDWTYLVQNNKLILNLQQNYKLDKLSNHIISGYFNIQYPYKFIESIIKMKYSFVKALIFYSKKFPFKILKNNTWLDFGLVSNYFHSKKAITTERAFNSLSFNDGLVLKKSKLEGKLDGEINWFINIPQKLLLNIPRFYSEDDFSYETEYLYINTLSELYVFGKLPLYTWNKIFYELKSFLDKLHLFKNKNKNINFDYNYKTNKRIKEFVKSRGYSLTNNWIYNGIEMPSLEFIINDLNKYIKYKEDLFEFIHGDFCFSNIMYDFKSNNIKTFDPRGVDFDNKITVYGDERYDFAKLMHSVVGLYDFIISGFYTCEIDNYNIKFEIDIAEDIKSIQNSFFKIFNIKKESDINAIMIHLFISMLPLHNDNTDKQNALLANVFRLYKDLKKG